ncbi:MAG TPA: FHA domain-containing protein [Candidatus Acidoferrum sp.]
MSNPNATPSASWIIGSDRTCSIVVAQPSVSAKHCRLLLFGNGFILEDLGSTNGTYVNSYRLQPNAPVHVSHTDTVTLGQTVPTPRLPNRRLLRRYFGVMGGMLAFCLSAVLLVLRRRDIQ